MKKLHAIVYGRVQGVGFRYFVQRHAVKLGLKGWVRNNEDGTVETLVVGDEEKISQMLKLLHEGPPMAHVIEVKYTIEDTNSCPFEVFFIRY